MAKPYLYVTYNGKTYKRQTDRKYTHAVLLVAFSAEAYMAALSRAEPSLLAQDQQLITRSRSILMNGLNAVNPWHHSGRRIDEFDIEYATDVLGGDTDPVALAKRITARAVRAVVAIKRLEERGDDILSWHGSHALAHKALAACVSKGYHSHYTAIVVPVDGAAA